MSRPENQKKKEARDAKVAQERVAARKARTVEAAKNKKAITSRIAKIRTSEADRAKALVKARRDVS